MEYHSTEGLNYRTEDDLEPQDAAMKVLAERGYIKYDKKRRSK